LISSSQKAKRRHHVLAHIRQSVVLPLKALPQGSVPRRCAAGALSLACDVLACQKSAEIAALSPYADCSGKPTTNARDPLQCERVPEMLCLMRSVPTRSSRSLMDVS
jgi:hypothetical protein